MPESADDIRRAVMEHGYCPSCDAPCFIHEPDGDLPLCQACATPCRPPLFDRDAEARVEGLEWCLDAWMIKATRPAAPYEYISDNHASLLLVGHLTPLIAKAIESKAGVYTKSNRRVVDRRKLSEALASDAPVCELAGLYHRMLDAREDTIDSPAKQQAFAPLIRNPAETRNPGEVGDTDVPT